jgi:hypothetical protein
MDEEFECLRWRFAIYYSKVLLWHEAHIVAYYEKQLQDLRTNGEK